MAKRIKVSPTRQAIYDRFQVTPEQQKSLQEQIEKCDDERFKALVDTFAAGTEWDNEKMAFKKVPGMEWNGGSREEMGNKILLLNFEGKEQRDKQNSENIQRRVQAHQLYFAKFQQTFGRNLKDFYPNHFLGFDLIKFDNEVLHSIDIDGKSMDDVLRERYGEEAAVMVKALI